MPEQEHLTVSQVMTEIGWTDRSLMNRYLENEQTRVMLGASGLSRPTYPRAALPAFTVLYQAAKDRRCTPKTAPMVLSEFLGNCTTIALVDNRISEQPEYRSEALVVLDSSDTAREMVQTMQEFIIAVKEIAPVREDSAMTTSQAAALICCAPKSVGRFVPRLRRGVYRRSDVMRYLASGERLK